MDERDPRGSGEMSFEDVDPGTMEDVRLFAGEIVERSGFDVEPKVFMRDGALVVSFDGPDAALFIEHKGELLEAMQLLLTKSLYRLFGVENRVVADSENYRLGRDHEIAEIARRHAEKVKQNGAPQELSLMNPYDRRIVHIALKDDEYVTTESSGDGFLKRVTIYPSRPRPK